MMSCVRTYVTYDNVYCPNLCYTRKYDASRLNTRLDAKMCNVGTYVPHEYEICSAQTNKKRNFMDIFMKIISAIHYIRRARGKYFMFIVILDYRLRYI